jgi:nucleoside-diphosphate-sugar epimerase
MRVFVTGATGYIGFAVSEALARAGHHVLGWVRSKEKALKVAAAEVEPVLGSIEDTALRQAALSCGAIVHCAMDSSKKRLQMDRSLVETLIGIAREAGAPRRLLYTSGVWLYGDTGDGVVDETSLLDPMEVVAGRELTEKMVLEANRGDLRTIVVRPGCVYGGPGGMTGDWFESAMKEGAARIVGDGSFRWSMIHLHDLADLYVRAVESPWGGEIFNASDRSRFTIHECARAASFAADAGGKVATVPLDEAMKTMGPYARCLIVNQHVDSSKAVRMLGWQPRHGGFVDGVARYFVSWKAAHGLA